MHDASPRPGRPEVLAPGLRRVLAPNPSAMTLHGTNTYLLGQERLAVIDPGPDDPAHLEALTRAIADRPVSHILVTHAHRDHSALAQRLARRTEAPVLAFGPAGTGRSPVMQRLAARGRLPPGPDLDAGFAPDLQLSDGEEITGADWRLTALHTPGHTGDHMTFFWGDIAFCGDLAMDWSSTVIAPPDGDLDAFLASCARLRSRRLLRLWPGHGPAIASPVARLGDLEAHRAARSQQILTALAGGPKTLGDLARRIYPALGPDHIAAAEATLLAHLISLTGQGLTRAPPDLAPTARFALA